MKKTTLFLLSSACVVVGCYSTPELNENKYRKQYEESPLACVSSGATYQNEGLRHCMETRGAMDEANKKTVQIKEQKDGTALVVPRSFDDDNMMQDNRVYEVVDIRSNGVVIKEGSAPETETTTTTTITVEKTKTSTTITTEEKVDADSKKETTEEIIEGFEAVEVPSDDTVAKQNNEKPAIEVTEDVNLSQKANKTEQKITKLEKNEKEVLPLEEK